jgi:hypothetical protein
MYFVRYILFAVWPKRHISGMMVVKHWERLKMRTFAQELVRKDKKLECNEECSQLERNKRMALALQIRHQHTSSFLLANYIL